MVGLEARGGRKRRWGWILTGVAAVLLAAGTAFAGDLGSKLADAVSSGDSALVSYSAAEIASQCIGGEFVPRQSLATILRDESHDWDLIERQPGAAQLGRDPVQVSVQGESARTITLTGIDFHVTHHSRPAGVAFSGQCGGPFVGRALEVDLDADPPRIVDSVASEEGMLGSRGLHGERLYRPVRFPWTVSLTDPLLLDIIATTESCYCEWSAEIPWVSGAESGTIAIDNDGRGYRVTGDAGLTGYIPTPDGWRRYPSSQ
jgi:hypothetical protein